MKGIVTFFGKDIKRIKHSVRQLEDLFRRCKLSPIIHKDVMDNLSKISRWLSKGRYDGQNNKDAHERPKVHS